MALAPVLITATQAPVAIRNGIAQPPADESDVFTFEPELSIRYPIEGEVVERIFSFVLT